MIVEKVQGRSVYDTWYTMSTKERQVFVESIVTLENQMFEIEFPASGSLYYEYSLDSEIQGVPLPPTPGIPKPNQFCVGPSSKLLWWYRERRELPVLKGPCKRYHVFAETKGI